MRRRWILVPVGLVTTLTVDTTVDRIVLKKSARRLTVFREGEALKSYSVALDRPMSPKPRRPANRPVARSWSMESGMVLDSWVRSIVCMIGPMGVLP